MSFEDGFKDIVHIFGISHATGRNDANDTEYKPEDIRKNIQCRINRKEKQQSDIKLFLKETEFPKVGDLVFSIQDNEMFQIEAVKPMYSRKSIHHITCILKTAPNMPDEKELLENV